MQQQEADPQNPNCGAMSALNPLAQPKGTRKTCELCGAAALLECMDCRVTYYCCQEHQQLDYDGIHARICEFLGPLRRPPSSLGTEKDRIMRREQQLSRKQHLMRLTRLEAEKLCNQGRFDLAYPAALSSLKMALDTCREDSPDLLPAYILLGNCSIGTGELSQAEEHLTHANWILMRQPHCEPQLKAQFYRALARLYNAKGNTSQALRLLADDVYHCSLAYSPEAVEAAGGYYLMGDIFNHDGKSETAAAMFEKVVGIWLAHLMRTTAEIDVAQESEAHLQLSAIAKHFDGLIPEPDDLRRTRLALARGALCAACKNPIDAQTFVKEAREHISEGSAEQATASALEARIAALPV